jgi:hypothetical protein
MIVGTERPGHRLWLHAEALRLLQFGRGAVPSRARCVECAEPGCVAGQAGPLSRVPGDAAACAAPSPGLAVAVRDGLTEPGGADRRSSQGPEDS